MSGNSARSWNLSRSHQRKSNICAVIASEKRCPKSLRRVASDYAIGIDIASDKGVHANYGAVAIFRPDSTTAPTPIQTSEPTMMSPRDQV